LASALHTRARGVSFPWPLLRVITNKPRGGQLCDIILFPGCLFGIIPTRAKGKGEIIQNFEMNNKISNTFLTFDN